MFIYLFSHKFLNFTRCMKNDTANKIYSHSLDWSWFKWVLAAEFTGLAYLTSAFNIYLNLFVFHFVTIFLMLDFSCVWFIPYHCAHNWLSIEVNRCWVFINMFRITIQITETTRPGLRPRIIVNWKTVFLLFSIFSIKNYDENEPTRHLIHTYFQ